MSRNASSPPPEIPDYELLKPIGRGSYGEVWLARSVTGVFRVIKIVRRDTFDDERPFLRELQGISRYQKAVSGRPRQLALLHVGLNEEAGYFYYVMEPADDAESGSSIDPERYVPLTLKELFARKGRLPARDCVQIALEIARGLAVLHGEKLIHRDIKPSNIIFTQGVPKLADVGLVTLTETSMTYVGTPGYVPPEGPGSPAADIYSLGKVIYELISGLDRNEYPKLPSDVAEGPDAPLARELNAILLRACHPKPSERHPSADAIARDLELVQAGRSVAFYEGLRQRLRLIAWTAAGFGIAAGAIAILVMWRADVQQRANQQARKALYRSDLAVAQLAKAGGDLGRARAALQRQIPPPGEVDLRGIEWAILAHDVRGEGTPLPPLTNGVAIRKVAADPSGRWIAASYANDQVAIWDSATYGLQNVLTNARIMGGFSRESLLYLDEPKRALRLHSLADGTTIRYETGRRLQQLLPDGRTMLVSPKGDVVLSLYNPQTQQDEFSINTSSKWGDYNVSAQCVSADGAHIALALYRERGAIRERWLTSVNLHTLEENWRTSLPRNVPWLVSAPSGNLFALNSGGLAILILNYTNSNYRVPIAGHTARVHDASISNDGLRLATACADQTVRIWRMADGIQLDVLRGLGRPARAVSWSADGTSVIAGDDSGAIRVFKQPSEHKPNAISGLYGDVHGDLVFSDDGSVIAASASSNSIAVVSPASLTTSYVVSNVFQPIRLDLKQGTLTGFGADWSVIRHNLQTGRPVSATRILPPGFSVRSWAVSPDLTRMAITGRDGNLVVANMGGDVVSAVMEPSTNTMFGITFSPDGSKIYTGSMNGEIRTWSSTDGKPIGIESTLDGDIQCLCASSDSKWLAAGIFTDASLRVFDRKRREWLTPRFAHRRFISALLFDKACARLISAGTDGKVILWRVPEFEEVAAFEVELADKPTGDEGVSILRLAPDESSLTVLTEDGRLRIWNSLRQDFPWERDRPSFLLP